MIENEYKSLLNKSEYEAIKDKIEKMFCNRGKRVIQTNFYYEDENLSLIKDSINVRVRQIAGKYLLQVKKLELSKDNMQRSLEWEKVIDDVPKMINKNMLKDCKIINVIDELKLIGKLKTIRTSYRVEYETATIKIEMDESEFFNIKDYEIEMEFTEKDRAKAKDLFFYLLNDVKPVTVAKRKRFFDIFISQRS